MVLQGIIVRWSAAKGIVRITSRLCSFIPVLQGDSSWHGGCLALAELARRGLLLPIRFHKVVPVVMKALHYDIRRGPHSIGSHVRDAAAYVCWAFGRAYCHADNKSILERPAPPLLSVACYDREVNCRRAAATAFEENVGRQGNYPHGINIVNTAEYFALSSGINSYLHIAVCIAQYDGYLYLFVDELLNSKIVTGFLQFYNREVSYCMEHCKVEAWNISVKIKQSLLDTLHDNLSHPNSQIQGAAVAALKSFTPAYLVALESKSFNALTSKYLEQLTDPNVAAGRGSALALCVLPFKFLGSRWKDILHKLCACCEIEDNPEERDVEARVNAVKGLTLFKALDDYSVDERGDVGSWVREVAIDDLERCTYLLCRGDLKGFFSKSVQMELLSVSQLNEKDITNRMKFLFDENMATSLFGGIVKQALEKMDKLRELAAKLFGISCCRKYVISGLVISIGDLQGSLMKAPLSALLEFLHSTDENIDGSREYDLSTDILWVLRTNKKCERLAQTAVFCAGILEVLSTELKGSGDFKKLRPGIAIVGYISSITVPINIQAFGHLLTFLAHRYSQIREASADQVYNVLQNGDVGEAQQKRLELCATCNLDFGMILKANGGTSCEVIEQALICDEYASYASLVGSSGF
ncbi:Tubulin-folding cofactor D [Capsicum baccatum]|uniref:Tubulin-folding cofactor D n=1 Tax=Capsicum baccatum TaxID=33114 RepID=A0A2G2X5T4_CAPBA|nr:Tubulin-folding cofactor D [Capsicum baccatum]